MKLQTKLLLPASVIQTFFEEFQDIYDLGNLNEKLKLLGMSDDTIKTVIKELEKQNLHKCCNSLLRTDQHHKTIFKNSFKYVEPLPAYLGLSDLGKGSFAQYVPIQETLLALFHSESVKQQYEDMCCRETNSDVMQDIWDGEVISKNIFFPV